METVDVRKLTRRHIIELLEANVYILTVEKDILTIGLQ